jgi:hypothetical protein
VHGYNDARQTEIHTAKPLVAEPSAFEFEMAVEKLRHKSSSTDQTPAALIKARVSISLLTLFAITRNYLICRRSQSLYLFMRRVIKQDRSNYQGISLCQLYTKFYPASFHQG